jgi:hypothetical protein
MIIYVLVFWGLPMILNNTSQVTQVYHAPLDHRTQIPMTTAAWWWRPSGQPPRWTEQSCGKNDGKNDGKNQPWILRHSSINIYK